MMELDMKEGLVLYYRSETPLNCGYRIIAYGDQVAVMELIERLGGAIEELKASREKPAKKEVSR